MVSQDSGWRHLDARTAASEAEPAAVRQSARLPTFRQRQARLVSVLRAQALSPTAEYLATLEASIAALPLKSASQRVLRMVVGLEEPKGALTDLLTRDRE